VICRTEDLTPNQCRRIELGRFAWFLNDKERTEWVQTRRKESWKRSNLIRREEQQRRYLERKALDAMPAYQPPPRFDWQELREVNRLKAARCAVQHARWA
jgi:hypothetical protein